MSMERKHKLAGPRSPGQILRGSPVLRGGRILRGSLILLCALAALALLGGAKDTAGKDSKAKDTKPKDSKAKADKAADKAGADKGTGGGKAPALAPGEALSKAKAEIAADHVYSADALLQQVVGSSSASA